MHNIYIEPASPKEADIAAKLTFMAYNRFSYDIFGNVGEKAAQEYYKRLWLHGYNRFGYRFSYISKVSGKPVGLMTCYPSSFITELSGPTIWQLIRIGRLAFICHFITHLINFYFFASNQETLPDDFYIATLSVLPKYRGLGIGAEMLRFARNLALKQNCKRCALHVNAENEDGIRFYERNGFTKTSSPEKKAVYYKMVHSICPY